MNDNQFLVETEESGLRLDQILSARFRGHYSRTYFQKLIEDGLVLLNGEQVKKRVKPQEGDEIEVEFRVDQEIDLKAENIPLDVLYEDDDIIVVNKPEGLVVHPAVGNWTGTFVNALLYHCQKLEGEGLRPGIVHRLDKDTTGVLIAAKNSFSHSRLVEAFAERRVHKQYLAVVLGNPGNKTIEKPIGRDPRHRQRMAVVETGKFAKTVLKTLSHTQELALVEVILETGRTHQIRVHLSDQGNPILGDELYGSSQKNQKFKVERQLLHAEKLSLDHPRTGKRMEFTAPPPEDMMKFKKLMT